MCVCEFAFYLKAIPMYEIATFINAPAMVNPINPIIANTAFSASFTAYKEPDSFRSASSASRSFFSCSSSKIFFSFVSIQLLLCEPLREPKVERVRNEN